MRRTISLPHRRSPQNWPVPLRRHYPSYKNAAVERNRQILFDAGAGTAHCCFVPNFEGRRSAAMMVVVKEVSSTEGARGRISV